MNCDRCGEPLTDGDKYDHRGQTLCEDCYVGALQPPKTCDVAAVYTAKNHRQMSGQSGVEGLLDIQKQIYYYIQQHGKATKQELQSHFNLPAWELDKQFAILRHCELLKGKKEDDKVYVVLFDTL